MSIGFPFLSSQLSSFPRHSCLVKTSKNPFVRKKSGKSARIQSFIFFFFFLAVPLRYVCVSCVVHLFAIYENIFHEIPESAFVHSPVLTLLTTCCPMENNLITTRSISVFCMTIYYSVLFLFFNVFLFWFSEKMDFFFHFFYMA